MVPLLPDFPPQRLIQERDHLDPLSVPPRVGLPDKGTRMVPLLPDSFRKLARRQVGGQSTPLLQLCVV
jgi:hypothetical protein